MHPEQLVQAGDQKLVLVITAHLATVGEAEHIHVRRCGPLITHQQGGITGLGPAGSGHNREDEARSARRPEANSLRLAVRLP
jgi:hypothetical protein